MWALGCAIFEIRAGSPLFESFFGSDLQILLQTVRTLGRLPDPWWDSFERRAMWFEEDGEPKRAEGSNDTGVALTYKTSIREQLGYIGLEDEETPMGDGPMMEPFASRPREEELDLLGDLLEKMIKYRPEERITMGEVIAHPWFDFKD